MKKRYEIDKNHSVLGFSAKHMVFTTVRGRFQDYDGYVEVEDGDFTTASGEFKIRVASIDSGNQQRDDHLRSADFFDAANQPEMTFRPTAVRPLGGDRYGVTGDLVIRGQARPIDLQVKVEGRIPQDPFGKERIALSATGSVNRKDWGLNWNMALETGGWLVGEEIKLEIESAFVTDAAEKVGTSAA